jgi:putative NADPH-quinone reductase
MKKILIINGHPGKEGLSSFMVSNYAKGAKQFGADVKILNVKDLNFDALAKKYPDLKLEPDLIKSQKLISWAEHIVFIYPTWWGSMPAILKGFIDRAFTSGFAYKYSERGIPIKLLAGKTGRIITSTGSSIIYVLANHVLLTGTLKYPILKFCGFGKVRTNVFHSIRKNLSQKRQDKIERKCIKLGRKDSK